MHLEIDRRNGAVIVRVAEPRIDAAAAIRFKDRMCDIAAGGAVRLILDLSAVEFIDSSGLGAIVSVYKLLGPDRRLDLAGLTPLVAKVFALTRMDRVFRIFPDLESAQINASSHG